MKRQLRQGEVTVSAGARRTRRHRQRFARGLKCFTVEVDEHALAGILLREGVLTETEALDHRKIEEAASRILATWVAARM